MKYIAISLMCLLMAAFTSSSLSSGEEKEGQRKQTLGHLNVRSLSVLDSGGNSAITLLATDKGPGVWLKSPAGHTVSLVAMQDQVALFVMGKDSKAANLALSISTKGEPFIQVIDPRSGEILMIDPSKLLKYE